MRSSGCRPNPGALCRKVDGLKVNSAPANAEHLSDEVKRRFYRNYFKSKKKAFSRYAKKYADGKNVVQVSMSSLADDSAMCAHACAVIRTISRPVVFLKKSNPQRWVPWCLRCMYERWLG